MSCDIMYQHFPPYFCPGFNQGANVAPIYADGANRCQFSMPKSFASSICPHSAEARLSHPYVPVYNAFATEPRAILEAAKSEMEYCKTGAASSYSRNSCKFEEGMVDAAPASKFDDDKETSPKVHYVSANCVLLTYYTGDIQSVIDEHFQKALSQTKKCCTGSSDDSYAKHVDKGACYTQRNFPPSFWNSNYGATNSTSCSSMGHEVCGISESFPNGFYASDWHYPFHEIPYTGSLTSQYNSLLLQPGSRSSTGMKLSHSSHVKPWNSITKHSGDFYDMTSQNAYHHFSHHYSTGLDCSLSSHDPAKDLYWI